MCSMRLEDQATDKVRETEDRLTEHLVERGRLPTPARRDSVTTNALSGSGTGWW
jgi:hypothetical protein